MRRKTPSMIRRISRSSARCCYWPPPPPRPPPLTTAATDTAPPPAMARLSQDAEDAAETEAHFRVRRRSVSGFPRGPDCPSGTNVELGLDSPTNLPSCPPFCLPACLPACLSNYLTNYLLSGLARRRDLWVVGEWGGGGRGRCGPGMMMIFLLLVSQRGDRVASCILRCA